MTAAQRFADASYWMRHARKRYRAEVKAKTSHGLLFRAWARRTYNQIACSGKLFLLVRR